VTGLLRLLRLITVFRWRIAAAVALGAATIGSGIGLMGTAAFLIASAALQPSIAELQVAIVGVRFFGLSRGVLRYLERLVSHDLTLRILGRLRRWFFAVLEPLAPARTIEMRSSDLLTRAVSDVESLRDLLIRAVAPPVVAILVGLATAVVLGATAVELALVFVAAYVTAALVIPVATLWAARDTAGRVTAARAELATAVADGIEGMADLLGFGRERDQRRRVDELSRSVSDLREGGARIEAAGDAAVTFAAHATVWVVLLVAIPMVGGGRVTGVGLAVVCLVAMAAFEAIQPLPAAARGLSEQLAAADRIFAILDRPPAVDDPADLPAEVGAEATGRIVLRDVSFSYPGASRRAVRDLSLELVPGQRVAVVGPSGAGKSTLVVLLQRFWDPSAGDIRLDGRRLKEIPLASLRSTIGVLPQRTDLFAGTIRDNLLLAAPTADPTELREAARVAGLLTTIEGLPEGWSTWIGEHGMQLSGGQRRRLALARLLLLNPRVVVLDEPTTGLDPVTEHRVMSSVLDSFEGRTTIVITHRLVAMDRFDGIVVLDRGRVVERGRHDELIAGGGLYRTLHDAQRLELVEQQP